jgi:DNA-binding MarR family transcriptional regulator
MDILSELGAFAFASRLKRLSDRLKSEATTIYHHQGADFNDSWFLVGYMLSKHESMTVSEMARALGISRPAISQIAGDMVKQNLIKVRIDGHDRRRKRLSLTNKGMDAVATLQPVWDIVGECTEKLLASTGCDILKALTHIEKELERQSIFSRVINKLDNASGAEASGV